MYTRERLLNEIESARSIRAGFITAYHKAKGNLAAAKDELADVLAKARANGDIEGKNEADREANARLMFQVFYDNVSTAESDLNHARSDIEKANNEVGLCRDLLDALALPDEVFA